MITVVAQSHPSVPCAAAIGVPHPKWGERPVLVVELNPGAVATADDIRDHLKSRIANWWMPDDFVFVEAIALGSTDKIDKQALREFLARR